MANPPARKKILVYLPGSLDSLVSAMAPAAAIRRKHPRDEITAYAPKAYMKLLEHSPDFDSTEEAPAVETLKQVPAYVQRIRQGDYAIVYDLRTSPKATKFLNAARPFAGKWVGPVGLAPATGGCHLVTHFASELERAGVPFHPDQMVPDMRWILKLRRTTRTLEPAYFGLTERFVLMVPGLRNGAAGPWEAENWAALANVLIENGVEVAVAGMAADAKLANDIVREAKGARSLAGRADMIRVAALAAQSRAVFTPLNALSYLAAAAGAPTVLMLGRKDPPAAAAAPRGPGGVIALKPNVTSLITLEDALQAARVLGVFERAESRQSA